MIPQKHFKQTRQAVLLAAISAAYPVTGYCIAAGQVDFAIGNVESVAANGNRHPLSKGSEIDSGDSINTGANGRVQVRFTDGGFISLQPGTTFRVDDYNYQNKTDGNEKGFFSLLKGSLRAITGVIGHLRKDSYQLQTPVGTIGIRGTGYNVALRDDGMFVNVGQGAIFVSNNAGGLLVTAGNAAFVLNSNTAPAITTTPPFIPPNGLQAPTFSVADQRDNSGNFNILSLPSGHNYAMAYAYTGTSPAAGPTGGAVGLYARVAATFSSTSQLLSYNVIDVDAGSVGTGAVTFSASDGIIGWGRWTNATFTFGPASSLNQPVQTFDYITGIPTANMPTSGKATYSLMGYTSPTATDGSTGYTVNGSLSTTFAVTNPTVNVNLTVANSANTINFTNQPLNITNSTASFSGFIYGSGSGCSASCQTTINGFFAGANAERAGLSYSISGTGSTGTSSIQGVAAFAKN